MILVLIRRKETLSVGDSAMVQQERLKGEQGMGVELEKST